MDGTSQISGLTIKGGSASTYGGGLYNESGSTLDLFSCTITGNSAAQSSGGLYNKGTANLEACTISDNSAPDTGGMSNVGMATLDDCTISGNSATNNFGGGLFNSGTVTLDLNCTISGNSCAETGGGLYNTNKLSIDDCTISGNTAGQGDGGGLYNKGTLDLGECTISGNTAVDGGGVATGGTATIQGCTIGGNHASDEYAGLMAFNGSTQLTDTIVAGNILPPAGFFGDNIADVGGSDASTVTGSHNLIGTGGSGGIHNGSDGNVVLTSLTGLGLAPLSTYGGTSQTMALLPGSPAIGAGTSADYPGTSNLINSDERGFTIGASVNIGAFQSQGFTFTAVAGSTPQSAAVGAAFGNPLAVTVKANVAGEPVAGGVVTLAHCWVPRAPRRRSRTRPRSSGPVERLPSPRRPTPSPALIWSRRRTSVPPRRSFST